jgi:hypothetical protein
MGFLATIHGCFNVMRMTGQRQVSDEEYSGNVLSEVTLAPKQVELDPYSMGCNVAVVPASR